ncbi:MAG: FliA/WhiG family RNA polymerase sigma factor [SAR324 cluster bacterium]|nr:FliA/WhiG family RNA polymerase sigma factor [SAR324 cluster bacterium]MBL7035795.1 FliA/WhiG family RNA polymerase sigma factor [SAR324 cluster bacterium]
MPTTKNPYTAKTQQSREDQLIKYAPLVKRVVTRMAARFPPGVDQDELYQVGMIGLLDAVDKFDPTRDVKFKTYAEFRIRGAILDELRSMDWVPRSVRAATNEHGVAWRNLTIELGREPSDLELAEELEMNLDEYHDFIRKASPTPLISIEEFKANSNQEDSVSLLEILAKPGEKDPFVLLSMQQMKNKLADAVSELDEREQLVLSLYYQEELNLKEIGEVLGVIESRVSQIRTKTILKLRAKLRLMTKDGME